MLSRYFLVSAVERPVAGEPFVHDDPQGVLVASSAGLALQLLWRHIGCCARFQLNIWAVGALSYYRQAKIAQQDIVIDPHEQVFGLDIAVNEISLMRIVQRGAHLSHIGEDSGRG